MQTNKLYSVQFEDGHDIPVVAVSVSNALQPFECCESGHGRIVSVEEVSAEVLIAYQNYTTV